jgi:hypothetical protein
VTCAGPAGGLGAGIIADVEANFEAKIGQGIWAYVRSAVNTPISPVGTIYVYASYAGTALADAEASLDAYLADLDIGQYAYLTQIVDALQYDPAKVRNVVLSSPGANVVPEAHGVVTKGSLAGLSVVAI